MTAASASRGEVAEPEVQAELVERFTRFVEWPTRSLPPDQHLHLCVIGDTLVNQALRRLSRRRVMKGRSVIYREVDDLEQVLYCHVLFIAATRRDTLEAILSITRDRPILTIGATAGMAQRGVLINIYRVERHLRFEINMTAAQLSGLRFGAKLLRLARRVGNTQGEPR